VFQPIGLDIDYDRLPAATIGLLLVMTLVLFTAMTSDAEAIAPYRLDPSSFEPSQLVTSVLLHEHPWHLFFNGLYLWVFGRYVEHRLGALRYLFLFLLFGAAGGLAYLWKGQGLPAYGASGAVSGMMAVVLFTAPKAPLRLSLGLWPRVPWAPPAWVLLVIWVAEDLIGAWSRSDARVGYTAHLGGFLAGLLSTWVLRSPLARGTRWYLPQHRQAGERHSDKFQALLESEASWRMIEEHLKKKREAAAADRPDGVRPNSPAAEPGSFRGPASGGTQD
jgi:membrane associated rhomboid family serine protease